MPAPIFKSLMISGLFLFTCHANAIPNHRINEVDVSALLASEELAQAKLQDESHDWNSSSLTEVKVRPGLGLTSDIELTYDFRPQRDGDFTGTCLIKASLQKTYFLGMDSKPKIRVKILGLSCASE